jgi:hypothetical protein
VRFASVAVATRIVVAQWKSIVKLFVWYSHINYLGGHFACAAISLSPTEELATKAASYARPTISTAVVLQHAWRQARLFVRKFPEKKKGRIIFCDFDRQHMSRDATPLTRLQRGFSTVQEY